VWPCFIATVWVSKVLGSGDQREPRLRGPSETLHSHHVMWRHGSYRRSQKSSCPAREAC
jgi:hypothetical protein